MEITQPKSGLGKLIVPANIPEATFMAFGSPCSANIAAMQDQPMMGFMDQLPWDVVDELLFGCQGSFGISG